MKQLRSNKSNLEFTDQDRALVFGELVATAIPVVRAYFSDLYRDAEWLKANLRGSEMSFLYGVRAGGSMIGIDTPGNEIHIVTGSQRAIRVHVRVDGEGRCMWEASDNL